MIKRFLNSVPQAIEKWFYKLEVWFDSIGQKPNRK